METAPQGGQPGVSPAAPPAIPPAPAANSNSAETPRVSPANPTPRDQQAQTKSQGNGTAAQGTASTNDPNTATTRVAPVKETQRTENPGNSPQPAPNPEVTAHAIAVPPQESPRAAAAAPPAPAPPNAAKALETTPPTAPAAPAHPLNPVKDLSIQVGQASQERVDVRLVDRGGELQVAVRAANPVTADGLRQGLSQLADRLEQSGFHTESWHPGANVSGVQAAAESRQKSAEFQNNGSPHSGGSQQQRRQGNQQQPSRPQWVMEMENTLSADQGSYTGDSYGIGN